MTPLARAAGLFAGLLVPLLAPARFRADRVFLHGDVWTGDLAHPRAQAIAVRGDRIVVVGSDADVLKLKEAKTEIVDLKGRRVVPGFVDAHVRLLSGELPGARLQGATTAAEVGDLIAAYARNAPPTLVWLTGQGFDPDVFPGGLPTREILDRLLPDRPGIFLSRDSSAAWCNTVALRAAGIARGFPDPPQGAIVRDSRGEPTGILLGRAQDLVRRLIPPTPPADRYRALLAAIDLAAAHGITSVQDVWLLRSDLPLLEKAASEGLLKVRVTAALPLEQDPEALEAAKEARSSRSSSLVRINAVAAELDGTLSTKSAAVTEPYASGGKGFLYWAPEDLRRGVGAYSQEGFQTLLFARGDRAVRLALDTLSVAQRSGPLKRPRVEDLEEVREEEIPRFHALGVVVSTEPSLGCVASSPTAARQLPPRLLPPKALDDSRAVQAFGSGWPGLPMDPLAGIGCAAARPQGSIAVEAALRHFTRDSAYAAGDEESAGTLSSGRLADLAVLSDDILLASTDALRKAKVLLTVMGGQDTFKSREF